ncbi:hypothetical protein BKA93DRAFT_827053 [Sparassis latifolia]
MRRPENVSFLPAQVDAALASRPLTATISPLYLFLSDLVLFFGNAFYLPGIVFPLAPWPSGHLDELYPSLANLSAISVHLFLVCLQLGFLLSLPLGLFFVGAVWLLYCAAVLFAVFLVCLPLNGGRNGQKVLSDRRILHGCDPKDRESWVFINGVAVGKHWLQSNLDRLSLTFLRPITGVHNITAGIVFDVLECLIQRDFSYHPRDVRQTYAFLKNALLNPDKDKVVLLAHSQGGIIASMALDWLYAELPLSALRKLEVYTFGCAANHFNNPFRAARPGDAATDAERDDPLRAPALPGAAASTAPFDDARAVAHVEHYANECDFVARWGVLHYAARAERFAGRVFTRRGASGHQLNQHYLDAMFPLDDGRTAVREYNEFVDAECEVDEALVMRREEPEVAEMDRILGGDGDGEGKEMVEVVMGDGKGRIGPLGKMYRKATRARARAAQGVRVRDLSRLWAYRNGMSPED